MQGGWGTVEAYVEPVGLQSRASAFGDPAGQDGAIGGEACFTVSVVSCNSEQPQKCCNRCNFRTGS